MGLCAKREQYGFVSADEENLEWYVGQNDEYYKGTTFPNEYAVGGEITWADMEAEGVVFLPEARYRCGIGMNGLGSGFYWASTPDGDYFAYYIAFGGTLIPYCHSNRRDGQSVRLVYNAY